MKNKTQLITPFLMLTAGMIASVIMYIRNFELYRMLWILLIVLIIFYIIGDITRYIYTVLRPRTIPAYNIDHDLLNALMNGEDIAGNVVAVDDEDPDDGGEEYAEAGEEFDDGEEGYSDEELGGYYDEDDASYDSYEQTDDEY